MHNFLLFSCKTRPLQQDKHLSSEMPTHVYKTQFKAVHVSYDKNTKSIYEPVSTAERISELLKLLNSEHAIRSILLYTC